MSREALRSGRILAVLLALIPVGQIGLDVYTPALPQMMRDFASSSGAIQNTVTAYMLGMSVAFLPVGLIADALGRKRVVLAGLTLMVVASVGCMFTDNLPLLLGLRFVQGIAASVPLLAATIAADCFRGPRLVSVMGLLGAAWGAAPVLAPAVGGLLVQVGSWRLVFGLLALVAALVGLFVARMLPETLPDELRIPVDLRAASRVVGKALRHRNFMGFVAMFSLLGAAQISFGVVGPFLYQVKLHFSPAAYGVIALALGAANLAGEFVCGGLARRTTTRQLALGALSAFCVGTAVLVVSSAMVGVDAWVITVGAALMLAGCGALCPQTQGLALGVFTDRLGLISGLVSTVCSLVISMTMVYAAVTPADSLAPIGWLYVAIGALSILLLFTATSSRRTNRSFAV